MPAAPATLVDDAARPVPSAPEMTLMGVRSSKLQANIESDPATHARTIVRLGLSNIVFTDFRR
jgi:hypothetical protein